MAVDANTKLLLHCDGADTTTTFTDASPAAHGNASVSGNAQVDTAQSKFGGASLLLDGTGDYLSYADHADWQLGGGTGAFTIDFWVRFNSVAATQVFLMQAVDSNNYWFLAFNQGSAILQLSVSLASVEKISATGSWSPSTNTWYHVAVIRTGNDFKLFIDGTQVGTTVTDADSVPDFAGSLYIGTNAGATQFVNGWMDEIRISDVARWTANFTPPIGPYGLSRRNQSIFIL